MQSVLSIGRFNGFVLLMLITIIHLFLDGFYRQNGDLAIDFHAKILHYSENCNYFTKFSGDSLR